MKKSLVFLSLITAAQFSLSAQQPTFSRPANIEDVPVYRLQVVFTTANTNDDSGTDDKVYVQLNSSMRPYYLDYGIDDRERGTTKAYDIVEPSVRFIRDIKQLNITKVGNDGWGIKKVELRVNGYKVFEKSYGTPHIIDGNEGRQPTLNFTSSQLRGSLWSYSRVPNIHIPPLTISKADLISMVEGFVGNYMRYIPDATVNWGDKNGINTLFGPAVEASYRNRQTLSFDLDLQVSKEGPNPELDIDFDLVVSCTNGKVLISAENGKANINFLSKFRVEKVELDLGKYLNRTFNVPVCNAHFNSDGSLSFL
ncbi:MAG: hypothetical protein DYG98_27030 [Haliscomenobacteraceae bacterium CHB4]|nr:hypothetical protein [Saprospiraceae bacterium]MCE7926712.1 hypothetical protein [Haliscomenobacteraceae bacterium CHB4]